MDLEIVMQDQCLLIRVQGELDHHWAGKLRQDADQALEKHGAQNLLLNLEKLTFMDSSGIGVLLGRYKRVSGLGGQMALCRVSPSVSKVLEISGVPRLIPFYQNEAEALKKLALPAQRRPK
jgi:stage II sporulation protein AA (anti-sigma F factor antagonist)